MQGRIAFPGNPWPEGHALHDCELGATLHPELGVRLQVHLTSEDYDDDPPSLDGEDDWTSPIVWANYEGTMLSSTAWGWDRYSGIPIEGSFDPTDLTGTYTVDALDGDDVEVIEDPAFRIYLLGHDAACDHVVRLTRTDPSGVYDLRWTGRLALTYAGDPVPRHRFEAEASGLVFDTLRLIGEVETVEQARQALRRHTVHDEVWAVDDDAVARRTLTRRRG